MQPVPMPPLLELQQLHFDYPQRPLFRQLDWRCDAGLALLLGDDGSGKTTLLRLLAGQLAAQSGRITLDGTEVLPMTPGLSARIYYDAADADSDRLSVQQWQQQLGRRYPAFDTQVWEALLEPLGLLPHRDKQLFMLSTGTRRKFNLCGAAASRARLILLEQPCAALDQGSARVVLELLQEAAGQSQSLWLVADYLAPPGLATAPMLQLGNT